VQGKRRAKQIFDFALPNRSLYYQKIVQGKRRAKQIYLILLFRTAAYIIKYCCPAKLP
jgi:hypothetical protein